MLFPHHRQRLQLRARFQCQSHIHFVRCYHQVFLIHVPAELQVDRLIFGKRLPEVGRSLGKGIIEFKKGVKGIDEEMEEEVQKAETAANNDQPIKTTATDVTDTGAGSHHSVPHNDQRHRAAASDFQFVIPRPTTTPVERFVMWLTEAITLAT